MYVCVRLYISLKLFIRHKELLRILLMLEIFVHWVEFGLTGTEWKGVAKPD